MTLRIVIVKSNVAPLPIPINTTLPIIGHCIGIIDDV